jgi:cysteine desulfurase/selenocysteine lyase
MTTAATVSQPAAAPLDPHALRADFPILQTRVYGKTPLVYLDNAATSQRPLSVIEAMVAMDERYYANVHRAVHWLSDQSTERYEAAREKIRAFLNARRAHEVIFTSGTTAAINLVARSWGDANVRAGDEILVTVMEHHSNLVPWHQLAERTGCRINAIPISDGGELILGSLDQLLTERTRLVAVAAVSNVLGTINPLERIIAKAHAAGALVLVDAAQSVPHLANDVQKLGVDFLAFSGHKMCGPSGIGVLYGREELLEKMPPFLGGGSMISTVHIDRFTPGELPAKFEAGTPPIVPAVGLGAAVDYLTAIGLDRIHAHEQLLVRRAHEILAEQEDIRLLGPAPEHKAGIVSFVVAGLQTLDLAQVLDQHGIAIRAGHHCTMPLHERLGIPASDRASFYFYNTLEEVEQLGGAINAARRFLKR